MHTQTAGPPGDEENRLERKHRPDEARELHLTATRSERRVKKAHCIRRIRVVLALTPGVRKPCRRNPDGDQHRENRLADIGGVRNRAAEQQQSTNRNGAPGESRPRLTFTPNRAWLIARRLALPVGFPGIPIAHVSHRSTSAISARSA